MVAVFPMVESPTVELAGLVDQIVGIDPSGLCDSELRDEIAQLRRSIDRLEYQAARYAAAADRRGLAGLDGAVSTPSWLHTSRSRPTS
jgi:hypothetical protein